MTYLLPTTVDSALDLLSDGRPTVIAGATDYYPTRGSQAHRDHIVDISRLDELRTVERVGNDWRIGALSTWTDIARADLPSALAGLQQAATRVGGTQIQNVATVAGNLCNASPAADGVPPLLALDARVELRSARGTREFDLAEFLLGNRSTALAPDEMMTAVLIPDPRPGEAGSFEKLGARAYLVISIVMVAAVADIDVDGVIRSARIAVGACSPVARRQPDLEHDLIGASIHDGLEDLITMARLADLSPIDDVRATAAYRLSVTPTLIARALRTCGVSGR